MKKKFLSAALVGSAIALNMLPVNAKEDSNPTSSDNAFVCAVQNEVPTMFSQTPGEERLTPVMSWHQEYLLPEQSGIEVCQETATKLQQSYGVDEAKYIKTETNKEQNLVCLVGDESENCVSEASQKLFSVNNNYDAGCVVENKRPIECKALMVRGIYSFDDEPYQMTWWFW